MSSQYADNIFGTVDTKYANKIFQYQHKIFIVNCQEYIKSMMELYVKYTYRLLRWWLIDF